MEGSLINEIRENFAQFVLKKDQTRIVLHPPSTLEDKKADNNLLNGYFQALRDKRRALLKDLKQIKDEDMVKLTEKMIDSCYQQYVGKFSKIISKK